MLPPRSKHLVRVETKINTEFVCKKQELCDGVYIGNSICKPVNGKVCLTLINANEKLIPVSDEGLLVPCVQNASYCKLK